MVEETAAKLGGLTWVHQPWSYATCDDFLPADVFTGLSAWLVDRPWYTPGEEKRKTKDLPTATVELLSHPLMLAEIEQQFQCKLTGCRLMAEGFYGVAGLKPHRDRGDKVWSGMLYVAGDPTGTEIYDASGKLHHTVEWRPNRLVAWSPPPRGLKHSAPKSQGRHVLLWWFLDDGRKKRKRKAAENSRG